MLASFEFETFLLLSFMSVFPPAEHDHLEPVTVRAVSELFDSEDVSIIVDSGSDAKVIPSKLWKTCS